MYHTDMLPTASEGVSNTGGAPGLSQAVRRRLEGLDVALGRLRRLWDQPGVRAWFRERLDIPEQDAVLYKTLRGVSQIGPNGASVNDVADVLRVDPSTASRFVERAVSAGFLSRSASTIDRRRSSLSLTEAGRERLRLLRESRLEMWEELTADWTVDDVDTLTRLLVRLDDAVIVFGLEVGGDDAH